MRIVELQAEQFKTFEHTFPYRNFYQTEEYGMLMNRHQFNDYYLGLEDDAGNIVAATLILVRRGAFGFKWGYCPRGYLIDFKNIELLRSFSTLLVEFLKKRNFMYITLDPILIYKSRNNHGEIVPGVDNSNIYNTLIELGYEHTGFNLNFENIKPRWNAVANFAPTDNIFYKFNKEKRNKIRKAINLGVEIYEGNPESIRTFYDFVEKKHTRKFNYYLDMYEIFGKENMFEIYLANLNTSKFVEGVKNLYEREEMYNTEINEELLNNSDTNNLNSRNTILKKKEHSDKLLNNYRQNIVKATNLFKQYPNGKIIGSAAIIKYNKEIFFLIFGYDKEFRSYCSTHLMLYQIMEKCHKEGYNKFNLNGISGDFDHINDLTGLTKFKLGFNAHIEEYLGEFTLTINKGKKQTHDRLSPILDWLNTPVL
ncbi:MAG: peptidoglycan bridge formation glycyltransferase FemA/FemB family protein [Bacilli bacterium]|nr:peptidoglycan bridge formation glycyltransferase FemA/FemB family protein [Bacilli bacterium]